MDIKGRKLGGQIILDCHKTGSNVHNYQHIKKYVQWLKNSSTIVKPLLLKHKQKTIPNLVCFYQQLPDISFL